MRAVEMYKREWLLKIIGCFEVALRNRIDRTLEPHLGNDWLRNRIAHHEPICFAAGLPVKSVSYAQIEYQRILKLFALWSAMQTDRFAAIAAASPSGGAIPSNGGGFQEYLF